MSKHIYILQNRHETNTPNNVIKKIYDMINQQEAHDGSVYDNESDFIGEVTLQTPTYKEWVDKIHEVFNLNSTDIVEVKGTLPTV